MGLLKSINRIFAAQPYVVTMSIVVGGVRTTISRGNSPVPSEDFLRVKGLSEAVIQYLPTQTEIEPGVYCLPFPAAKRLIKELRDPALAKSVKLNSAAVEVLRIVPVPSDFRVQWHFEIKRQVLVRQLVYADGYLGAGFFYQDTHIWHLEDKFSSEMLAWLGKEEIEGNKLTAFVTRGLSAHRFPYFSCELHIEPEFSVELKVIKLLKLNMDVQVVTNRPDLKAGLTPIKGCPDDLLSGNAILPGWGNRLHGILFTLASSGEVKRLSNNELAEFIFDHSADFAALGVSATDITRIRNTYPVYDGALLPATWQLIHQVVKGIGCYQAVPCLKIGNTFLPIEALGVRLQTGARFYATDDGWIALTPAYRTRYTDWQAKKVVPISLLPQEILGTRLDRLNKMRLAPPQIDVKSAIEERDQAILFFEAMRRHGLPAGVSGLQTEIGDILAQVCKRLLQDNNKARILWIIMRRHRDSVVEALKRVEVPFTETLNNVDGRVTILSRDVVPPTDIDWTLLIFSDLDLIASVESTSRTYALLPRSWAICTFSRPDWAGNNGMDAVGALRRLGGSGCDLYRDGWQGQTRQTSRRLS